MSAHGRTGASLEVYRARRRKAKSKKPSYAKRLEKRADVRKKLADEAEKAAKAAREAAEEAATAPA